ncbi:MAG TPA: sn-glycerol-3-phosphate ABC transporter ATP-binding protein UgpC [Roseiarcus sp.]|nr:sn-glycerol-3-phosphate ABC transporter ATP-binding protein UgpC [Roseiarcus sp.]
MAEIDCRKVVKAFGSQVVVRDIDLHVEDKEFVVFLGPSGCGKSTILRMIAGLEDISGGEIAIGGRVVNDLLPRDRDVAMVFQNYALYPHMSAYDNVAFGLRRLKTPKAEIDRRVRDVAGVLRLEPLLDRHPSELSGGEQQRVAIARAMIKTPAVFLFDEPLSNLDAKLRNHMRVEIARLHQRLGTTTIYVTHDQLEAMTLADRIVLLKDGRIEQVGTPRELFDRPRTQFAASFVGTPAINFLEMTAYRDKTSILLKRGEMAIRLPMERLNVGDGAAVVVGFRPAHLRRGPANGDAGRLSGRVDLVEFLGNEALAIFRVGEDDVSALLSGRDPPTVGERIEVGVHGDDVHVFDAATGLSLCT